MSFSPGEITEESPQKRAKVPPQYEITTEGTTHRWTGRGRIPLAFKAYVDQGDTLDKS